jgi:hypothetical protein
MCNFATPLCNIAEEHSEGEPDTPPIREVRSSVKLRVKPVPRPGLKLGQLEVPGIDDKSEASGKKYTRRSLVLGVPNKPKKYDERKRSLADPDPVRKSLSPRHTGKAHTMSSNKYMARLGPEPQGTHRKSMTFSNLDIHRISGLRSHKEISSVSSKELPKGETWNQGT